MMKNKISSSFIIYTLVCSVCSIGSIAYAEVDSTITSDTIANDHEGFVIEWEDGNMSDFLSQVNNMFDASFDSVDVFGMFGSSESDRIKAHDYHRQDTRDTNNSTDVARVDTKVDAASTSDAQEQPDWRYERKWWQRGTTPVL